MQKIVVPMLELKVDGATGAFACYGAAFNNVDLGGDIIIPGAFADDVKGMASGDVPGLFYQHNPEEPIGSWTSMVEDKKGLRMEGQLWTGKGIPRAEQAFAMMSNPGPKGFSIGYKAIKYVIDDAKQTRTLSKLKTREVSVVTFPMNQKARLLGVKSMSARELEQALRDEVGMSAKEAKALLSGGFRGLGGGVRDASSELSQIAQAIRESINH